MSRGESDNDPSGYTGTAESVISDADYTRSTLESDTYGTASGYTRSPPSSPNRAMSSSTSDHTMPRPTS